MSLLSDVKNWTGRDPDSPTRAANVSRDNPLFVYVKIPGNIQPLERADRFEEPLQIALKNSGFGEVTGGGSQLDDPDEQGRARVEFCGIDIDLYHVDKGLSLLHSELQRIGVPQATVLLYELDGEEYEVEVLRE